MPIFEYRCLDCEKDFEKLVRASDPALVCPHCGGAHLNKKLSAFAAVTGGALSVPGAPAPCGACGHPAGPGACGVPSH
jgi:putative FmdB family regulatory protein